MRRKRNFSPAMTALAAPGWIGLWIGVLQAPVAAQQIQPDPPAPAGSTASPSSGVVSPPPGTGLDIMQRICTACHDIGFVTAVRRDRAAWNDTVLDMVNRGASATPEEIEEVVAYLATNFAPK